MLNIKIDTFIISKGNLIKLRKINTASKQLIFKNKHNLKEIGEVIKMKEIFARRSIRKYTSKKVEEHKIKKIIKAGFAAPSCGNQRITNFIIIRDRDRLDKIADIHGYAESLRQANAAVAVCANLEEEMYEGFWVQDCAAAAENMLTEAVHLDLGAVWLGVHPKERIVKEVNSILELPEHVKALSIISLGYPAEEKKPSDRYLEEKVHHEKWQH